MYIDEGKNRYKNRNANRPNFLKGRQSHIPSQTIGNAKIQINSESAIQELKNLANKYKYINDPRGFLTDLRNALGIPDSKGASKYGVITIPKEDGTELVVSLRITNHQANADTYIKHNANCEYNLSIVIRRKVRKNTFKPNDNVVLDEFVYYGNNLQKVESPLSKIAEGLIEYLTTGNYEDKTGVALPNVSPQPNTNNQENINCNRNMNKNRIRLTESQLHRVIKESVKRVLHEVSTDTAIAAHKKAQRDIDNAEFRWDDDAAVDRYEKRQRQADTFAKYAQDKGANYFPYGVIGWEIDDSDGVFDRSQVIYGDSIDDVPNEGYGIYALTREGKETYEQWCEDASAGYDLCYGRMQGLARSIGGREWDIWNYLTSDSSLARKII